MICEMCKDKPLPHDKCRGGTHCDCQHREGARNVTDFEFGEVFEQPLQVEEQ